MTQRKINKTGFTKDDITKNGDESEIQRLLLECRKRDAHKVPYKLDSKTTILVSKKRYKMLMNSHEPPR